MLKPGSLLAKVLGNLLDHIIANILFLTCCLPVVTIGPALCSLYAVEFRICHDEEGRVLQTFFGEFRRSFVRAVICELCMLTVAALIAGVGFLAYRLGILMTLPAMILAALVGFLFAAVSLWLYPLIARFEDTPFKTLRNALVLSFSYLPVSALALLLRAIPVALFLILPAEALRMYIGFVVFFVPSLLAYADALIFGKIFRTYETAPEGGEADEAE